MVVPTLSSWNSGYVKSAILDFVARVTDENGADYVPPAERIAVFGHDGTLWCEHPLPVQAFFLLDRVKLLAAKNPDLVARSPLKVLREDDHDVLQTLGRRNLTELFCAAHANLSVDAFERIARGWFSYARNPEFGRRFIGLTYQPQLELLAYLRAQGFKTWIVSGGSLDLMRACAPSVYGIPREQVIGSSVKLHMEVLAERPTLMRMTELETFNDGETKVHNIGRHIGRRPIFCCGNADGDLAMLRYTAAGPGARLALLLQHDDADRECAYDRELRLNPSSEALDRSEAYGITVIGMKQDWVSVFSS